MRGAGGGAVSPRLLALGAAVLLLIGVSGGFLIGSASSSAAPKQSVSSNEDVEARAQSVIPSEGEAPEQAEQSEAGAVKASTAFLTGIFNLSLQSESQRLKAIDDLLSPNATPESRDGFNTQLGNIRQSIIGPPNNERPLSSKVLSLPGSYRIDRVVKDSSGKPVSAHVVIWMQTIQVDSADQRSRAVWTTNELNLDWTDHWRISYFGRQPGPTPELVSQDGQTSTYADVINVFNGFNSYRYATQPPK